MQKLKPRMAAAAAYARPGKRFADVGTDHAFLPVYLCESGLAPGGVASDIHKGPLDRARQNIGAAGLSGRVVLRLSDGLDGAQTEAPEDIYILGMGGELIVSILERAPWVQNPDIRLILQPMTHAKDLRAYLLSHGFAIPDEVLVAEEERIYQVIYAAYDGTVRQWSETELVVGKANLQRNDEICRKFCAFLARTYLTAAEGLEKAGKDGSAQRKLAAELDGRS